MQAQVNGLESKVSQLKDLLKVWDQEIVARDLKIAKGRKQRGALEARASESEDTLNMVLVDLTNAHEAKDRLATELDSSQARRVTLAAKLNTAQVK